MNNNLKIPIYVTITNSIIERIKKRELLPGSKIPSENELISVHGVSNTTARKVLQEIENAGWALKVRGKGTFVKDFIVERSANKILSFTKNMTDQGLTPTTHLFKKNILDKDVSLTVSGKSYVIPKPVFEIQRLRLANNVPMMFETRYISMRQCPDISQFNLERSLYEIYFQEYHLNVRRIEQDISAIFVDETSKSHFGVIKDIPGFKIVGVTFCGDNTVLECEKSIYRGDKYKFSVQAIPH